MQAATADEFLELPCYTPELKTVGGLKVYITKLLTPQIASMYGNHPEDEGFDRQFYVRAYAIHFGAVDASGEMIFTFDQATTLLYGNPHVGDEIATLVLEANDEEISRLVDSSKTATAEDSELGNET